MVPGHLLAADISQLGQVPPAQASVLLPSPAIGQLELCSPTSLVPAVHPHLVAVNRLPEEAAAATKPETAVNSQELRTEVETRWMEVQAKMMAAAAAAAALTPAQESL